MPTTQELLKKFKGLKTLPHVAIRLSKLISDESTPMAKFEEVIRMDPTLVLRLLQMVNSSFYGLRQKVDSIPRAVVYIGMKNLRNMLVIEALKDFLDSRRVAAQRILIVRHFDGDHFFLHQERAAVIDAISEDLERDLRPATA